MEAAVNGHPVTIDGVEVRLAGRTFTIAPLSFRHLQQFKTQLAEVAEAVNGNPDGVVAFEMLPKMIPLIGAAIRRNNPEVTDDDVTDLVDMGNYTAVFRAILAVNELNRPLGEGKAQARAVQ
jgi:hypothetical protein